jgi:hypothetical protein
MLGWINQSIEAFITQTFGADKWLEVVAGAEVSPNWVSSKRTNTAVSPRRIRCQALVVGLTLCAHCVYAGFQLPLQRQDHI